MLPAIMLLAVGGSLIYGAIKDVYPWCPWVEAFGGTCDRPSPGSTADQAFADAAGTAVGGAAAGGGGGGTATTPVKGGNAVVPNGSWCHAHVPLSHYKGMVAQPAMIAAFKQAEQAAGRSIPHGSSYRNCAAQAAACAGTSGPCAPPGQSCHQLGLAVDGIPSWAYGFMTHAGFCNGCAFGDCGHFSLQDCGEC